MHVEKYSMSESHSGRQLLQSSDVNNAGKLYCNRTGLMFLYAEDISIVKDGKNTTVSLPCDTTQCLDNATVYVVCPSSLCCNEWHIAYVIFPSSLCCNVADIVSWV